MIDLEIEKNEKVSADLYFGVFSFMYKWRFRHGANRRNAHRRKEFFIELNGNDAARDFASRLPMELQFEDFAGTERIAYLNPKLNVGEAPTHMTPQTGDVAYYIPWGNLAVFVRNFRASESLVPLGRMSEEAWRALQSSGDESVRFGLR